jgi:hypothetical protein
MFYAPPSIPPAIIELKETGFSLEAIELRRLLKEATEKTDTISDTNAKRLLAEIERSIQEEPEIELSEKARVAAENLAFMVGDLPGNPEVVLDNEGNFHYDWNFGKKAIGTLIPRGDSIVYSVRVEGEFSTYGEEKFFDAIPEGIRTLFVRAFKAA